MTETCAAYPVRDVVTIRLLGTFAVRRGSADIPLREFGGRRAQQLLRLLALRRGTLVPKDVIAEALWPHHPSARAAADIQVLVSRVRRAIGDRSLVQTGPGGYRLADDARCQVDAETFLKAVEAGRSLLQKQPAAALAAFREALRLWGGEPLAEDAYALWAQEERECLGLALLEALEGAAAAALATDDPAYAVWCARRALSRDRLRESAAMLLVQALAAGGDQARALAEFDSFGRRLAEEAGLTPSPAAQALRQRVLLGSLPCRPQPAPTTLPLHEGQRQLACLLAVLGRPAPPRLLADATGAELPEVLALLADLGGAGLISYEPEGSALQDAALGRALAGTLSRAEKARAHGLLAHALQRTGADAAEVATHLLGSGDRDAAAAAYAAAASWRLERLRDADAIRLAEAGLSLRPAGTARAALLEARAEACRRRGRIADSRADLSAALESLDHPADRSRVLAELGVLEAWTASLDRGRQLIDLAVAEAGDQPRPLGQALAAAAIIDLAAGDLGRARHRFRRSVRLLDHAGDRQAAARQLYWRAMVGYMSGELRKAVIQLGDLVRLPAVPAELLRFSSPEATLGHTLAFLGEAHAGLAAIDQALERARSAGYPALESECLWRRSEALAFGGQVAQAIESAQQAVIVAARIRHASCLASSLRGVGIAWEAAGRLDRSEAAFRRSLQAAARNPFLAGWASARLGACLARQGRPEDAAGHVRAAMTLGTPLTRYEARWAHAELLAARGDVPACRVAAAAALRAAEHGGYLILAPRLRELAED